MLYRLKELVLSANALTGKLPRSLMQLDSLDVFRFGDQDLCAPGDDEFQAWLRGIRIVTGATCSGMHFADEIADQFFPRAQPIAPLELPEAAGGAAPITYALTPVLPPGLGFVPETRTISGTPTTLTGAPVRYTYTATDAAGSADSLHFSIEVYSPVAFAAEVADHSFPRAQPIAPLVLPEAVGGVAPITYALTPALPPGLGFAPETRTISGAPREVTAAPVRYTYTATDAAGSADSLQFNIEVYSPVAVEHEALPESFALHGNYPNPFRNSTRIVFDLPWPARVGAEVMDATGRRVLTVPAAPLPAGRERTIAVSGAALSSGLYLYRLVAASAEGSSIHTGRFMVMR